MIANFITKFTPMEGKGVESSPQLSIHIDRSSNKQAGKAGMVLHSPKRDKVKCMIRFDFPKTNNEAKYEALAKAAGAANMFIYCDSQVVTSQVNGDYDCKNKQMKRYLEQVKNQVGSL